MKVRLLIIVSKKKRIKKKRIYFGPKRAGANYCLNVIGNGIRRRYIYATGEEPSVKNIKQYLRWFYHNSSQKKWVECVAKYITPSQTMFYAKHLLPSNDGRYANKSVINEIKEEINNVDRIQASDIMEHKK